MLLGLLGGFISALSIIDFGAYKNIKIIKNESENNISYTLSNLCLGLNSYSSKIIDISNEYPLDLSIIKENKVDTVSLSIDQVPYESCGKVTYGKDVYNDSEGYLTMTTIVYDYGYKFGNEKLFYTQVYVEYNKNFYLRNTDSLIIYSGDGSVPYFDLEAKASFTYNRLLDNNKVYNQDCSIDYSNNYGIIYNVELPSDNGAMGVLASNQAYNWKLSGDYYFIAKSTTFVQACYVHNESLFYDKLSISIKLIGIEISGGNTKYFGKGINVYV